MDEEQISCPNCKGIEFTPVMETHPSGGRKLGPLRVCTGCGYGYTAGYDDASCTWYLHPETARLVDEFAEALKRRLLQVQMQRTFIHQWMHPDWRESALKALKKNIEKDQPLDVAAYAAFFWRHGWSMTEEETSVGQ